MKYLAVVLGMTFATMNFGWCAQDCTDTAGDATRAIMSYDIDRSGSIDVSESLAAYPEFKPLLMALTGANSQIAKAVFTYILKYKRLPAQPSFMTWLVRKPLWKYERSELDIYHGMVALYCSLNSTPEAVNLN